MNGGRLMRRQSSRARPTRRATAPATAATCAVNSLERRLLLSTVAYWRFEERAADQEFSPPAFEGGPGSGLALDDAGGDDALRTYSAATNPVYRASVPGATVAATGAANNTSLEFNPNEDLYTAQAG